MTTEVYISEELHEEENLRLLVLQKELIWNRLCIRWTTKHQKTIAYCIVSRNEIKYFYAEEEIMKDPDGWEYP